MKPKVLLSISIAALLGCLLQIVGLIRYVNRLPDDVIGITLYIISIIAFAAAAMGYFLQWHIVHKDQNQ